MDEINTYKSSYELIHFVLTETQQILSNIASIGLYSNYNSYSMPNSTQPSARNSFSHPMSHSMGHSQNNNSPLSSMNNLNANTNANSNTNANTNVNSNVNSNPTLIPNPNLNPNLTLNQNANPIQNPHVNPDPNVNPTLNSNVNQNLNNTQNSFINTNYHSNFNQNYNQSIQNGLTLYQISDLVYNYRKNLVKVTRLQHELLRIEKSLLSLINRRNDRINLMLAMAATTFLPLTFATGELYFFPRYTTTSAMPETGGVHTLYWRWFVGFLLFFVIFFIE